jgi:hypothetical protein
LLSSQSPSLIIRTPAKRECNYPDRGGNCPTPTFFFYHNGI